MDNDDSSYYRMDIFYLQNTVRRRVCALKREHGIWFIKVVGDWIYAGNTIEAAHQFARIIFARHIDYCDKLR